MKSVIFSILCFASAYRVASDSVSLNQALMNYFENEVPHYQSVIYDLNSDGLDDAIIYVRDSSWCGSAGCTMFVFKGSQSGFVFLSRTTIVQLPLSLSDSENEGWKTLIVNAKGHGRVVLKGSDDGYPLNPSLQPLANDTEIKASRELLDYD